MKSKYSEELKRETAEYILETKKTYEQVGKELGVGKNTIYKWMREYKERNGMKEPINRSSNTMSEDKKDRIIREQKMAIKERDREIASLKKKIEEERMNVEILKKSLHIFMAPHE